ncbi:MAG: SCO family protein [Polyangia bacterium]
MRPASAARVASLLLSAVLALPSPATALPPPTPSPRGPQPLSAAAYEPNLPLVTHEGRAVRFYDDLIKNRVAIINFMFTSCPSICPPMTQNLVKVQKLLADVLGERAVMISISVDPDNDTPEVLAAYARRFGVGRGWYFVTGERPQLEALAAKLGNTSPDKLQHSGMVLIGSDAARTWTKAFAMSPPEDIARKVREFLALKPAAPAAPAPVAPPPPAARPAP